MIDHMQFGVRWQLFADVQNNLYDASRPALSKHSSYAQFWINWAVAELARTIQTTVAMSAYLKAIDQAVNLCASESLKAEFVMALSGLGFRIRESRTLASTGKYEPDTVG